MLLLTHREKTLLHSLVSTALITRPYSLSLILLLPGKLFLRPWYCLSVSGISQKKYEQIAGNVVHRPLAQVVSFHQGWDGHLICSFFCFLLFFVIMIYKMAFLKKFYSALKQRYLQFIMVNARLCSATSHHCISGPRRLKRDLLQTDSSAHVWQSADWNNNHHSGLLLVFGSDVCVQYCAKVFSNPSL